MLGTSQLRLRLARLLPAVLFAMASSPHAGEFVINPLRVSLDKSTKASEIIVRNDDKVPLRMQVEAMGWSQGGEGPDQYAPAEGLLYFPRTMEIPPGDSRVIRVGVRAAPVTREEAYRLFIEELPPAAVADDQAQGTSLRVFLRVGVAVFVAPAQSVRKGEITSLDLNGRHVEWVVANTGNVHFRADPHGARLRWAEERTQTGLCHPWPNSAWINWSSLSRQSASPIYREAKPHEFHVAAA